MSWSCFVQRTAGRTDCGKSQPRRPSIQRATSWRGKLPTPRHRSHRTPSPWQAPETAPCRTRAREVVFVTLTSSSSLLWLLWRAALTWLPVRWRVPDEACPRFAARWAMPNCATWRLQARPMPCVGRSPSASWHPTPGPARAATARVTTAEVPAATARSVILIEREQTRVKQAQTMAMAAAM